MPGPSSEATLRRLADLEAIRDLARRYAHCVWQRDAEGAIALFCDDAEMDTGDRPPIRGRAALLETYRKVFADADFLPYVHNHVIELGADGETATGTCYLDLRTTLGEESMIGSGYYEDVYVRIGDVWRFQCRKLNMRFLVPLRDGWAPSA